MTKYLNIIFCAAISFLIGYGIHGIDDYVLFPCSEEITDEIISPNHKSVLITFVEGCGATSDFATAVRLAPHGAPEKYRKDEPFLVLKGWHKPALRWTEDGSVAVKIEQDVEVVRKAIVWGRIPIEYE